MRYSVFAILLLSACMPQEETQVDDQCGAAALQDWVGQPVSAMEVTALSQTTRVLPPGSAMTMDHRPDRLNIDTDEAGVISRLWCG